MEVTLKPDADGEQEVQLEHDALRRAKPDLVAVLRALHEVTSSMSGTLTMLAADPTTYLAKRDELDRLDVERRAHLERLGALAYQVLVLRDADAAVSEPSSLDTPGTVAAPVAQTVEHDGDDAAASEERPAPLSREAIVAALEATTRDEGANRPIASDDKGALLSLANHVGIDAKTPADLDDEISSLERATTEARITQWKKMSDSAQVRWVAILVAWAKALEEETRARGDGEGRVAQAFRRLRVFSKYDSPGYIHGFARDAMPPSGESWRSAAVELFAALRGRPRESEPRRAPAVVYDEEFESEETRAARVPEDWPYFSRVRGKNVVMLGGEVREERRAALEDAFECATFTWVPHNRPRLLQALAERAAQGTVDIILVNKFVAHKETSALERVSVAPVIVVRLGYGVTAVKTALEEYFGRRGANDAGR